MNDLVFQEIKNIPEHYSKILDVVEQYLPEATLATENYNKSSSQFKSSVLDVVDLTPISSARHLLAVIQKTRHALEEASINLRRKRLDLSRKEKDLLNASEDKVEEILIDIDEIKYGINNIEAASRGALRKISHALIQYQNILKKLGKDYLTEEDYEKDQVRYHIMTAFNQALTSARSRGGLIDEGNHIYLMQLGINGAIAQAEVTSFLKMEEDLIRNGKAPTHEMILNWLEALADAFFNEPEKYANNRGFNIIEPSILLSLEK